MIQYFYEMVRTLKKQENKYWSYVYKLNKLLVNLLYPLYARLQMGYGLDDNSEIIVSLTSYPARIDTVWLTISSLLNQTLKPKKVILWLAKEQFPNENLPKRLLKLKERGLEIVWCEDLKPHKKYYYAMEQYPDYFIVTADDDILYPENHLEQLWRGYEKYPDSIICHWSHRISFKEEGSFLSYNLWIDNDEDFPSFLNLAVGCNGILYPPNAMPKEAFNKEKIKELVLNTDDLWLKCMSILNDIKVINCNKISLIYFNVLKVQKTGLWRQNTREENRNDKVWQNLMKEYPTVYRKLKREDNNAGEFV